MLKHVQRLALLAAMMLLPWMGQAQSLSNYQLTVDTVTFQSIVSTGTSISFTSTDDGYGTCTMPFAFDFGESSLAANSSVAISANGFIYLGATSTSGTTGSYTDASYRTVNGAIAQDAHMGRYTGAGCYYQVDTEDGIQCLTIEFHLLGAYSSPYGVYSHQVKFYSNGTMQIVYDSVDLGGATSRTLRTLFWDGPNADLLCLSGTWANPVIGTSATTMPTTGLPVHGMRYTFSRPVFACPKPIAITASNIEGTSFDITWTDTSDASNWVVMLTRGDDTIVTDMVSDTAYSFTNLVGATNYQVSVAGICSNGDTSMVRTLSLYTACTVIDADALPFAYGFEDATANSSTGLINACWHKQVVNYSTQYPYPSDIAHTGAHSLYGYSYSGSGYECYVVTPEIGISWDSLMVTFWNKSSSSSYSGNIRVGTMTDPTDRSTFHLWRTCTPEGVNWTYQEVPMAGCTDTGRYIAFLWTANGDSYSFNYAYLDDITLDFIPACLHISDLTVEGTTPGGAILTWTNSASDAQALSMIEYREEGDSTWTLATSDNEGTSYNFVGLNGGTNYEARVAALCASGDTSDWEYTTFTTGSFECVEFDTTTLVNAVIGTGTSQQSNIPVNSIWGNTLCQSIYLASELIAEGLDSTGAPITDITLSWTNSSSYNKDLTIYLCNTTQSAYTSASSSQWVPVAAANMVYTGAHLIGTNGDVTYHLDTPFNWDGHSNIAVTITMNQPAGESHSSSGFYGISTVTTANRSMYKYQDSSPLNGAAISSISPSSTSTYRPNIGIRSAECTRVATCAAPAVAASYITADSVTLTWAAGASETEWNVLYRLGTTGDFTYVDNVSDQTYTFENLNPATTYTFRVQVVCDPDTFNADIEVMTACARMNSVFEDFQAYSVGSSAQINPCWTKKYYTGSTTTYPYPTAIDGTNALYFYGYNNNNSSRYFSWVATPEMMDSLSTYEVEFDMRKYTTSSGYVSRVAVGAMTDPEDISTFDTIAVIDANVAGLWESKYVSLENYHDTAARYIAFLGVSPELVSGNTYTYNYFYLDNIYVGRRSSCPRPNRFHARDITNNSAELAWDGSDDHMSATIKWSTANNEAAATDSAVATGNTYQLTSLNPSTTYYAWIYANCAEENSRTMSCSFTTAAPCNPVSSFTITDLSTTVAAFTWDDDDVTPASSYVFEWKAESDLTWNTINTTNTFYFLSGLTEGTSYMARVAAVCSADNAEAVTINFTTPTTGVIGGNEGVAELPTYPYYNYSISEQIWLANELIAYGDTINGIYFNASSAIASRDMKIYITDTTLTNLSTSSYVPSTNMTLVYDSTHNITAGWNLFAFSTPYVRNSANNLVVMVADETGDYDSFNGWYAGTSAVSTLYGYNDDDQYSTTNLSNLDPVSVRGQMRLDATVSAPACVAPRPVTSAVTDNSIQVTWLPGGNETSWSVEYRAANDTVWNTVAAATTDTFATATGLTPSTSYIFRIGSICASGNAYATLGAYTACGTFAIPYLEDFNHFSSNVHQFNPCWQLANPINAADDPYTVNITGAGMMMLMPQGSYVIFPALAEPINTLQLRFDYVVADTTIYTLVGVCSHPTDYLSMTVLDTVWAHTAGVPEQNIVTLDGYEATTGYICIYSSYNQTYYDNIRIEAIPTCGTVDSLSLVNVTTTSADFSWIGGSDATSYVVEYGPAGGATTTVTTTTPAVTLTGLNHSTTYQMTVTTICANLGDTSLATNPFTFNTNCAPVDSLPYVMDFDHCNAPALTYTGIIPNCWNSYMLGASYYATGTYINQIYNGSTYASSGNYSLSLAGRGIVVLPEMPTDVDSLQITFHDYNTYISYGLILGVCDSNTPGCEASFVPVDTILHSGVNSDWYTSYGLAGYTGTGRYIAIKNFYNDPSYTYDYSYHYIDDITIDYLPSCLPTQDVHVAASAAGSVDLTWTDLRPAYEWEVSYATHAMTDPSTGTTAIASTNPYTITGLADSIYYFYVRTICGAGDTSEWNGGFSARPGTWNMRANVTDTVYMCAGHIYDDGGINGSYSNSQNSTLILMPSDTMHRVRISVSYQGESCCDYLGIYDGIGTANQLYYNYGSCNIGPFLSTNGPITITFSSDGSVNYPGFDITVECVSEVCRVQNIRTDTTVAPSASGLAVTWNGTASEYQVEYGAVGFTLGTGTAMTVFTNQAIITGLTSMANYDVYVRGICDLTDTGSWEHATLTVPMCDNVIELYSYDSTMSATTSNYAPLGYSFYNYGFVQTLIDSAQLAGMTEPISAWAFSTADGSQGNYFNHMDVYFANVPETSLSTTWIVPDSNHQFVHVLNDANLCYTDGGWHQFGLDTTFTWDGHSNLLVTVNRGHGSYSNGANFNVHSTTGVKTHYSYNDSYSYTVNNPGGVSASTGTGSYVGDMKFLACGSACAAPAITSETHDYQSATITWAGSGAEYQVAIKESAAPSWPAEIAVTGNTYTFNGLNPATYYTIRVRQDCTIDSIGYSDWTSVTFMTDSLPCLTPSNLTASNMTNAEATFDWTANGTETSWDIHVWYGTFDSIYRVAAHPATVGGFTAGVTYNAAVRALCGSALLEGDWSDAITFTTATCPDVTGLATSNVSYSTVDLSWNADPMAQSWIIEYGNHGFNQGAGTTVTVNTNSYHVTGLSDETNYDFYVRAVCGTDWNSEGWASVSATTLIADVDSYYLTVLSSDPTMGTATGSGEYYYGETATMTATANEGYVFTGWNDGVTDNPRSVVIVSDTTFTAMFQAEQQQGIDGINGISCTIYPNPATSSTTISVEGANGMVRIAVVDINGRTVASETIECSTDCAKTIDIDALAQGAYFVRITGENVNMVKKLIVR